MLNPTTLLPCLLHPGWLGNVDSTCLPASSWVLSSDQIRLYRAQRGVVHRTTGSGGLSASSSAKWAINAGGQMAAETSDWACAALLHYSRELSLDEVQQVEAWLDGLYAVVPRPPPPSPPAPPPPMPPPPAPPPPAPSNEPSRKCMPRFCTAVQTL